MENPTIITDLLSVKQMANVSNQRRSEIMEPRPGPWNLGRKHDQAVCFSFTSGSCLE